MAVPCRASSIAARGSTTYRVMAACCHPPVTPLAGREGGRSAVAGGVDVRVELVRPPEAAVDVGTCAFRLGLLGAALLSQAFRIHPGLLSVRLRTVGVRPDAHGLGLALARRQLVVAGL